MSEPTEGDCLTHLDEHGRARMVRVADKPETHRGAIARARVRMGAVAWRQVRDASGHKGDALQVARIAGIQASKQTASLIPLCHPVRVVSVEIDASLDETNCSVTLEARVEAVDRTGVEMEAMTAAAVGALTVYDMIKSIDRGAVIEQVVLVAKWGGKSGRYDLNGER